MTTNANPEMPKGGNYNREKVVDIINSVISRIREEESAEHKALFEELTTLNKIIDEARREISTSSPGDINNKFIPSASDELDAVVKATEEATSDIMDAVEIIEDIAENKLDGDVKDDVANAVTKIYEACSFQDITGQRITKVTTALQNIESKVGHLLEVIGKKIPGLSDSEINNVSDDTEDTVNLMEGPQLPGDAIKQDDIDKLLADFDD